MLKELVLKNFKSFKEETIQLSPSGLTVLVGPNGSGKSSVLEALACVTLPRFPGTQPAGELVDFVRSGCPGFEAQLTIDSSAAEAESRVFVRTHFHQGNRLVSIWAKRDRYWRHRLRSDDQFAPEGGGTVDAATVDRVYREIPFPRFFDVDLKKLRSPLRAAVANAVRFSEQQVIQVLFDLKMGADEDAFKRLVEKLRRVVPAVKGLAIQRQADGDKDRYPVSFITTTGSAITATQVSEGTLLALAILAAAERRDGRTLLLIDDIDRALHPTAQRELIRLLRGIVKEGGLEIVCTTHSPYILSEFQYDEVRVLKEVDGESRCMSLSDGPEARRWMEELDAGEYWSFVEHRLFQKSA